jgi:hypothetical protein
VSKARLAMLQLLRRNASYQTTPGFHVVVDADNIASELRQAHAN